MTLLAFARRRQVRELHEDAQGRDGLRPADSPVIHNSSVQPEGRTPYVVQFELGYKERIPKKG